MSTVKRELPPAVRKRQAVEKRIVRQLLKDAIAAGYTCSVSYERGWDVQSQERADSREQMCQEVSPCIGSVKVSEIIEHAFAVDECHLFFHDPGEPALTEDGNNNSYRYVYLVFGNDGWDVVCDYTTNLEDTLTNANALADKLSG